MVYHQAGCPVFARFLNLSTIDIWEWIFVVVLKDCPVRCRKLSSISRVYPVETSSDLPITSYENAKCLQILQTSPLAGSKVTPSWETMREKRLLFMFDWHTDSVGIHSFKRIIIVLPLLNIYYKVFYLLLYILSHLVLAAFYFLHITH